MNSTVKTQEASIKWVIPQAARERLGLKSAMSCFVLCKSDRVVMMPKPKKFSSTHRGACIVRSGRGARAY